jgi:hypothetical protein
MKVSKRIKELLVVHAGFYVYGDHASWQRATAGRQFFFAWRKLRLKMAV